MSTFDDPSFDPDAPEPRTSRLAIGALVSSLVCCVPVTTLLGVVLGVVAMVRIGGNPALRGRGLALAAILLGVASTTGQMAMYHFALGPICVTPTMALRAAAAGDLDRFRGYFHGAGAEANDVETSVFAGKLDARYGAFRYAVPRGPRQGADTTADTVPYTYVLVFDKAEVDAEISVAFTDPSHGGFIGKLDSIHVRDASEGDAIFPLAGGPGAATVPDVPDRRRPAGPVQEVTDPRQSMRGKRKAGGG